MKTSARLGPGAHSSGISTWGTGSTDPPRGIVCATFEKKQCVCLAPASNWTIQSPIGFMLRQLFDFIPRRSTRYGAQVPGWYLVPGTWDSYRFTRSRCRVIRCLALHICTAWVYIPGIVMLKIDGRHVHQPYQKKTMQHRTEMGLLSHIYVGWGTTMKLAFILLQTNKWGGHCLPVPGT